MMKYSITSSQNDRSAGVASYLDGIASDIVRRYEAGEKPSGEVFENFYFITDKNPKGIIHSIELDGGSR